MFRKQLPIVLGALMLTVPVSAAAAELDSSGIYCFQPSDFAQGEQPLTGICLTEVPGREGAMRLGLREIRPGDVLTVDQLSLLTFSPRNPEADYQIQVGFLPIFENRVAKETSLNLSIRGREDKPPVAEDSAMETYKNLANTGKLKVHDPEGMAMTFTVTRQPKRGTVEIADDGSFTYTPKNNKVGVDSFTYTATDPAGKVSREATVTVTILKPTDAAQYTDTAGKDCCFAAEWMKNTGIFTGEALAGNACFCPEKTVTRGEFLSMLVKTLDIPVEQELTYSGYTDDVPTWLKPYLAAAVRSGLTAHLPNRQEFGQAETMTGAEAAAMLCGALDLEPTEKILGLDETAWAERALATACQNGFDLEAEGGITRGQAAEMMYRIRQMLSGKSVKLY